MLTSHVTCFVLIHHYFPKYMCSAHYGCFCTSLVLCFLIMFLGYFLNDFEMVLVAPIITDITPVLTVHMLCISSVSRSCFRIFWASFWIKFLSPEIATALNIHVSSSLSRLWFPVYCYEWFYRFALFDSPVWLPNLHDLFLLILVHYHASVHCLILPPFPCIC